MNTFKNSKIMLVLSVMILFILIGSASAADETGNETFSTSTDVDTLSQEVDSVDEEVSAADTNIVGSDDASNLSSINSDDKLKSADSNDVLGAGSYSFSELNTLVKTNAFGVELDKDVVLSFTDTPLVITKNNFVLDGKGHTIDFSNREGTFLVISASNFVLKNLKIINAKGKTGSVNSNGAFGISLYPIAWIGDNGVIDNLEYTQSLAGIKWDGNNGLINNSYFHDAQYAQVYADVQDENSGLRFINSNVSAITGMGGTEYERGCYEWGVRAVNGFVDNCRFSNYASGVSVQGTVGTITNSYFYKLNGALSTINLYNSIIDDCSFRRHGEYNSQLHRFNTAVLFVTSIMSSCTIKNINMPSRARQAIIGYPPETFVNCTLINNNAGSFMYKANINGIIDTKFINNTFQHRLFYNGHGNTGNNDRGFNGAYFDGCLFEGNKFSTSYSYIILADGFNRIYNTQFINNNVNYIIYEDNVNNKVDVRNCEFNTSSESRNGWAIYLTTSAMHLSVDDTTTFNNESYSAIYPDSYDSSGSNHVYVSWNGTGDGTKENPASWTDGYQIVDAYGIIEFVNYGDTWENFYSKVISKPVTIKGNNVTITNSNMIFQINANNVRLENLTLKNCGRTNVKSPIYYALDVDGAYYYNLMIVNCSFIECTGQYAGVISGISGDRYGFQHAGQNLHVINSTFIDNQATSYINFDIAGSDKHGRVAASAILIYGSVEVVDSVFTGNNANYGPVIKSLNGVSTISGCNFTDNKQLSDTSSTTFGVSCAGAVYAMTGEICDSRFINNSAPNAGALNLQYSLGVNNCTFVDNKATANNGMGGAIYSHNSLNVYTSNFTNNSAINGGAVYSITGLDNFLNCNFTNNSASSNGGIFYTNNNVAGNLANFVGCNFTDNVKGIYVESSSLKISDCNFTDNTEGCIIMTGSNSGNALSIYDSTFTNNTNNNRAVLYSNAVTNIILSKFTNNSADYSNGVIYLGHDDSVVEYSNFVNNSAETGGVLYIAGDNIVVRYSNFTDNIADSNTLGGGAIYIGGNFTSILYSKFQDNFALCHGGAIYIHDGVYYAIDKNTLFNDNVCEDHEGENESEYWNDIYRRGAFELLFEVYVVLNPDEWKISGTVSNKDGKTRENATSFNNAINMVAPTGSIIFVNASEVYTYNGDVNTLTRMNVKLLGNNTTMVNVRFVVSRLASGMELHNLTFKDNNNTAVLVEAENVLIDNCTFQSNKAKDVSGLGLFINADGAVIVNSSFIDNEISEANHDESGAALFVNASSITISDCIFDSNHANWGSHMYLSENSEDVIVNNTVFNGAKGIDQAGHGVLVDSESNIQFLNCNFTNNEIYHVSDIDYDGAGVLIRSNVAYLIFDGNIFVNNTATGNGGALSISGTPSIFRLTGTSFINNTAKNGGALYVLSSVDVLNNCSFINNSASNGSAVYIGDVNVVNSFFAAPKYNQNNNKLSGYIYSTESVAFDNVTLSFTDLDYLIKNQINGSTVDLEFNYLYFNDYDCALVDGVVIDKNLTIDGNGFTLDGNNSARVFNISSSVELRNLNIINGNHTIGGAIYSTADLKLTNVTFKKNRADKGSAIYIVKSNNTWNNLTFENNTANNATVYFDGDSTVYSNKLSFTDNIVENGLNIVGTDHIYSPVFYVVNEGIGFGIIPSEQSSLTYAVNNVLPNGVIYLNGDFDIDETIKLNNFINVTFIGNVTTFNRKNNVKYLFILLNLNIFH